MPLNTHPILEKSSKDMKDLHFPHYHSSETHDQADKDSLTPDVKLPLPAPVSASVFPAGILSTDSNVPPGMPSILYDRPLTGWPDTTYSQTWAKNRRTILKRAARQGWDIKRAAFEMPIVWGHVDKFKHLNNVHYLRYFENAQLGFIQSLFPHISAAKVTDILEGQNDGFIIKSHNVSYKAPVTHPDSLIIFARPKSVAMPSSFRIEIVAWSLKTDRLVATCETECILYNHNLRQKAVIADDLRHALQFRIRPGRFSDGGSKL